MEKPKSSLTKICSNCGQRKPLSAFLQLTGSHGSSYGNICSSCRKTTLDNEKPKEKEEGTTSTTGFKIDSKSKTHEEIDKKILHKQAEDLYHEDRDKKAEHQLIKEQKIENIAKGEKIHRQTFLKKSTFLDSTKKRIPDETQPVFGGEQQTAKEKQIDLTAPILDTQIVKEKYKGSVFNQFKSWLGTSAPIVRAAEQAAQKNPLKANEKLSDYVNKTWGPGSKKR